MKPRYSLIASVVLCILSVFPLTINGALTLGGSGKGLYFSRERCDILGLYWQNNKLPLQALTFEAWLYIIDPHNKDHTLLAYSEFDGSATPRYDNPDGLQIRFSPTKTRVYRGSSQTCSTAGCGLFHSGWVHFATTWDAVTGKVQIFVNGVLENEAFRPTVGQFGVPLTQHGSMYLGQEADAFAGLFDENQSFDGMLDEVRIWSLVRSPAEIARDRALSFAHLDPAALTAMGLALYYDFDDDTAMTQGIVTDQTSNGNNGQLGQLINNIQWCSYSTSRPDQAITKPKVIYTPALPITGSQPVQFFLAPGVSPIGNITLRAYSNLTMSLTYRITAMPAYGALTALDGTPVVINTPFADKVVVYTYDTANYPTVFNSLALIDSFTYSSTDGTDTATADVQVRAFAMAAPNNLTYTTDVRTPLSVNMGTVLADGTSPDVVLVETPSPQPANSQVTGAALYLARFKVPTSSAIYSDLDASLTGRTPMTVGQKVDNKRGIAWFVPPTIGNTLPALPQTSYIRFAYRYQHAASGVLSDLAYVTIRVDPVNSGPSVVALPTLTLDLATAPKSALNQSYGTVTLTASDPDGSFTPSIYYRITRLPKFGKLYQVDASGRVLTGTPRDPVQPMTVASQQFLPVVSSWAVQLMNASSQYNENGCPANCVNYLQCDRTTCTDFSYSGIKILGPNDAYPSFGDNANVFNPATKNGGAGGNNREWFEISLSSPIYISQIEIFETLNPGQVTEVYIAEKWLTSSTTTWHLVWSGQPVTDLPAASRVFSPPICILPQFAAQYVRIQYRTDLFPGAWTGYDAVRVSGTLLPPSGRLTDYLDRVAYVPNDGVYVMSSSSESFDSFAYRPNDCQAEAKVDTVVNVTLANAAYSGGNSILTPTSLASLRAASPFMTLMKTLSTDEALGVRIPIDGNRILQNHNDAASSQPPLNLTHLTATIVDIASVSSAPFDSEPPILQIYDPSTSALICSSAREHCIPTQLSAMEFQVRAMAGSNQPLTVDYVVSAYINVDGKYLYLAKFYVQATQPETPSVWTSSDHRNYTIAVSVLGVITLVYVLLISVMVYKHRNAPVFRAASPFFCALMLIGSILASVYTIINSQYEPTKATCMAEAWIGHFAYALTIGVLLAKSWRVNVIFRQKKIQVIKITDTDLLLRIMAGLSLMILYLILWSAIGTPQPTHVLMENVIYVVCESSNLAWSNVIIGFEGLMLFWGVVLCIQQRNFPTAFNESQSMAVVIYNTTVLGALAIGTSKGVLESAQSILIAQQLTILICTIVLVSVMFIPKYFYLNSTSATAYNVTQVVSGGAQGARNSNGGLQSRLSGDEKEAHHKANPKRATLDSGSRKVLPASNPQQAQSSNHLPMGRSNDASTTVSVRPAPSSATTPLAGNRSSQSSKFTYLNKSIASATVAPTPLSASGQTIQQDLSSMPSASSEPIPSSIPQRVPSPSGEPSSDPPSADIISPVNGNRVISSNGIQVVRLHASSETCDTIRPIY